MYATPLRFVYIVLFFFSLLIWQQAKAQHFLYESDKFSVARSGYHKIELNSQIVNRLNASLANIRIYDPKEQEIQYVVQSSNPISPSIQKIALEIYQKNQKTGCCTEWIMVNAKELTIDNLLLEVNPFEGQKTIDISGSQDHQQWFVLKDTFKIAGGKQTHFKLTGLKRNDYKYIRVRIDDFDTPPLAIQQIGMETSLFVKESYNLLPQPTITQTTFIQQADSITYVDFSFEERQYINWLDFQFVTKTTNYAYNIELQTKKDSLGFFEHSQTFQYTPEQANYLVLPKLYGQYFRFKIHNYKQPRLRVANIQPYQLKYYLIANLEANQPYLLRFGGEHRHLPTQQPIVSVQIPDSLEIVYPDHIKMIGSQTHNLEANIENIAFFSLQNLFLGGLSLVLVVLVVLFMLRRRNRIFRSFF